MLSDRVETPKSHGGLGWPMARVLFVAPIDAERREVVTRKASGAFEPVVLEDLPAQKRGEAWATEDVIVSMGFPREFPLDFREKAGRPSRAPVAAGFL